VTRSWKPGLEEFVPYLQTLQLLERKILPNCFLEEKNVDSRIPKKVSQLVTRVCPSGTRRLVYRVRPIKEVENYKDSKIDLETKKDGSNPYSTRTLVILSPVAYIKPGRGALEGQVTIS
jgi:hypothetical protein